MAKLNLDFDDALIDDAVAFGLAQGGAVLDVNGSSKLLPSASTPVQRCIPTELAGALYLAREIYGETNSKYAQVFCLWVQDVLEGGGSIQETRELWKLVVQSKDSFGAGGYSLRSQGKERKAQSALNRKQSIWCAASTLRAVLNWKLGRRWEMWVVRAQYRALLAEKDRKRNRS